MCVCKGDCSANIQWGPKVRVGDGRERRRGHELNGIFYIEVNLKSHEETLEYAKDNLKYYEK